MNEPNLDDEEKLNYDDFLILMKTLQKKNKEKQSDSGVQTLSSIFVLFVLLTFFYFFANLHFV